MKLKEVSPNIFHISFKSMRKMCKTMLRFQEHYESPKFKDKIFSLKEFKEWYRTQSKTGKFTYYSDWAGFNIPSYVFKPFLDGKFKRLTKDEKQILNLVKKLKEPYYVITSVSSDHVSLEHEMVHGLYYVNEKYRNKVDDIIGELNTSKQKKALKKQGYHKSVFVDEINAYSVVGPDERFCIEDEVALKKLSKLYKKYGSKK